MRKVNLFVTLFTALLLSVFGLTAAQAKVAKNKVKFEPKNTWAEAGGKKVKAEPLATLTFEQLARLNGQKRAEYIGLIRQATRDLDKIQRSFKGMHMVALNAKEDSSEMYAYEEALKALIGPSAYAADGESCPRCIYALNLSCYPPGTPQGERKAFQCLLTECNYGGKIKGVRCGWVASGLVDKPGVGCLPIEKATNAINKTEASEECWKQRSKLTDRNASEISSLLGETEAFYGFPDKTVKSDTCKSDRSRRLMNSLIERSYSDQAYAQLVKIAYFCQARGGGMPDGLMNPDGQLEALTFSKLTDDWSGLNDAAAKIFKKIQDHCSSELSSTMIADIKSQKNLKLATVGSYAYEEEVQRGKDLDIVLANPKEWGKPNRANVLEVDECKHAFFTYTALNNQLKDIRGTLPRIDNGQTPEVPEGPTNGEIVDVEPSGCSENVAKDESQLAQSCARSAVCLIQSHEARKTGKGTYRPSRKYLSLVSTMALACGDGEANDTTVSGTLMVDYWMAFGHCSAETYEWTGRENKEAVSAWAERGKKGYWSSGKGRDDSSSNPDKNDEFKNAYGMSFSQAKKMFCGDAYKHGGSENDRARFIQNRRNKFNSNKQGLVDNVAACISEASANAQAFSGANACYRMTSANDTSSPGFQRAQTDWIDKKYPTMLSSGGSCLIAKQIERYQKGCAPSGKYQHVCNDRNRDGIDDEAKCKCGEKAAFLVYVDPGVNDEEYRYRIEAREKGESAPVIARLPNQSGSTPEWIASPDSNVCTAGNGGGGGSNRPSGR